MAELHQYLTEQQIAERFSISRRTVQRWRELGSGPRFVRLGERRIAYSLTDALAWAAARTHSSRAAELARVASTHP